MGFIIVVGICIYSRKLKGYGVVWNSIQYLVQKKSVQKVNWFGVDEKQRI